MDKDTRSILWMLLGELESIMELLSVCKSTGQTTSGGKSTVILFEDIKYNLETIKEKLNNVDNDK